MSFGGPDYSGIYSRSRFGGDQAAQMNATTDMVATAAQARLQKKQIEAAERTARYAAKRQGGGGGIGGIFGSLAGSLLGPIGSAAGGAVGKALFGAAGRA